MAGGEIFGYSLSDSIAKDPKPVTSYPHKPLLAPKRALNVITIGREESMTFQASKLVILVKTVTAEALNTNPLSYWEG